MHPESASMHPAPGSAHPASGSGDSGQVLSSPSTSEVTPTPSYRETGTASWYGGEFQGRRTASGEIFDMYGMSAAHRTLPLGTVIRVTNLDNSRNITLKVNDRGPFVRGRVLELSYGAARELGFAKQGTATVRIETTEPVELAGAFTVQAAVFAEEESAKALRERLQRKYEIVMIVPFVSNAGTFYRVRVGAYGSEVKAEHIAVKLTLDGLEPVVVRKD
jgi:rare lipoprotein A